MKVNIKSSKSTVQEDYIRACQEFPDLSRSYYDVKPCLGGQKHISRMYLLSKILKKKKRTTELQDDCFVEGCPRCKQINFKHVVYLKVREVKTDE